MPQSSVLDLEALLVEQGAVQKAQMDRARRVAGRLQTPRPVADLLMEMGHLSRSDYERISLLYRSKQTLSDILHEEGALDEAGLAAYRQARAASRRKTDRQILVDGGLVSEERYLRALASRQDIPFVEPEAAIVDIDLLSRSSIPYLEKQKVLPFRKMDGALHVIMADPENEALLQELSAMYGMKIKACCAPAPRIREALKTLERFRDAPGGQEGSSLQYREIEDVSDEAEAGEGAVHLVDFLLFRAIGLGASDLHVEPLQEKLRVRVRVDGVLRPLTDLPKESTQRLTSRIKVLAGNDIAERRLHQDGRIFVKVEGREVDIRVSTYVSMYGETIVLRILDRKKGLVPLSKLGFEPKVLTLLQELVLRTASGLVLVTGPTGSGKTTTLYSFVDDVNSESVKVISCEDPVEYVLDGITQCSVNQKTGPTFTDSLRAILRQDPDIIVVGEVRDRVTASLAVEAALTGHKVFSTFHTEDAVGSVVRLLEMGVEPFLVASTLSCIVAQRLVRRLCPSCAVPGEGSRKDMRFLNLSRAEMAGLAILKATGCEQCGESGFSGRLGVHEVLMPDDDFRDAILRHAPSKELRQLAKELPGFLTLQEDGLMKVLAGQSTLAEIADSVPRDPAARPPARLREMVAQRRSR